MTELSDEPDMSNRPVYDRNCRVRNVVDGDTFDVELDLGYEVRHFVRIRLRDIDTREIHGVSHESEEYERGMVHYEWAMDWIDRIDASWPYVLYSKKYQRGYHNRVIGDLWCLEREKWLSRELYRQFDDVEVYE